MSTGQPESVAYRIVNDGCSGQCSCEAAGGSPSTPAPTSLATPVPTASPTPAPTPASTFSSSGSCDDDCRYSGRSMYKGVDSCRNRLHWVMSTGQPESVAYRIVNEGCSGQCSCAAESGGADTSASAPQRKACWGALPALAADEGDHLETVRTDSEA